MKTLKTIFILLALVCANSSFAQTQEETIAWIKEKLEKHGISEDTGIEVMEVEPCVIYYKRIFYGEDGDTEKFNPSESEWSVDNGRVISKKGKIIEGFRIKSSTKFYTNWITLYENGVPDIEERFAKALNHLATFCEKKKETF